MYVIWAEGGYYLQNDDALSKDLTNAKVYKSLFKVYIKSLTSPRYYYLKYDLAKSLKGFESAMKENINAVNSLLETICGNKF